MKRLLFLGEEKGYRHEAVSHAAATIERLGRESGLWTTTIRTDTEVLTKKKIEYNAKTLNDFDAVMFYTGGDLEMNDEQKASLLSFVHDDGKGFIGVHSATITFTSWPEYGEMIGGYFDEHPWVTFDAPIIVEDPSFPGMAQWGKSFVLKDEIYQMKRLFARQGARTDAAGCEQARSEESARASHGSGFCGDLGEDVRQGARVLHDAGTRRAELGRSAISEDDG